MDIRDMLKAATIGRVYRINIAELIKALDGSCDCGTHDEWLIDCFSDKATDDQFPALLASILENGLTLPLNVIRNDYDEVLMGNGHHRLVAALLCGIEDISIVVSENNCDWHSTSYEDDSIEYGGELIHECSDPLGITWFCDSFLSFD